MTISNADFIWMLLCMKMEPILESSLPCRILRYCVLVDEKTFPAPEVKLNNSHQQDTAEEVGPQHIASPMLTQINP